MSPSLFFLITQTHTHTVLSGVHKMDMTSDVAPQYLCQPWYKSIDYIKFLLVVIDYFTKWIKARPLLEISANEVEKFLTMLGVMHLVTSIEHPKANDQVEAANKVTLKAPMHTELTQNIKLEIRRN